MSESDIDPEDKRLIEGSRKPAEEEWSGPDDDEPIETDPATAERVRVHKKFEESMAETGLLADDHSVRVDPEDVVHEEPPGTEQSAG